MALGGAIGAGCRHLVNLGALRLLRPELSGRDADGQRRRRTADGASRRLFRAALCRRRAEPAAVPRPPASSAASPPSPPSRSMPCCSGSAGEIVAALAYVAALGRPFDRSARRSASSSCGRSHEGRRDADGRPPTRPASGSTAGSSCTFRASASGICRSSSAPARCGSTARASRPRRGSRPARRSACRRSPTRDSARGAPAPLGKAGDREALQAAILHEDADVIVLNKPYGLAVQGGSGVTRHVDQMLESLHRPARAEAAARASARPRHRRRARRRPHAHAPRPSSARRSRRARRESSTGRWSPACRGRRTGASPPSSRARRRRSACASPSMARAAPTMR